MPMDSNAIMAMLQQQNAAFAGMASYAQQITPPMGAGPGMGMGFNTSSAGIGYHMGPAPMQPPMPMTSSWNPGMMGGLAMPFGPPSAGGAQAMGESLLGTGLAGFHTMSQGLGTLSGFAGLGAAGLGIAGMGGSSLAMGLSAVGSAPVALGLGAMAHGAENMYQGFQQRQGVNQVLRSRFGNVMGVGSGRGGMGFSTSEMGGISSMLREMGTEDLTSNMEELTRIMGKTADMGLYRGIQSAREFKQKFQSTVDSLKEIAEIMHTTLEGATNFMSQGRSMGFFTGQDISRQLAATRVVSSATGMSIDQAASMSQQGAQLARATGGRGRQGAQAGLMAGGRIAMAQSMGYLSDDAMAFATGGLTGAEGAAALSGRMQETSMRFMQRGAGRAMVAGLWDPTSGGISQERLNAVMSGSMDIRDLLRQGRRSISQTGGRQSEFFRDEEQLRSQVLAQGGEYLPMAIYGTHVAQKRGLGLDDPIVQRMMRKRFGMGQGEVEAATTMMQQMPMIQAEFLTKGRQLREQEAYGSGKEVRGIQGLGKRLGRIWEREVQNPFRQFADDLTTDVSKGIESMVDTMEGRISSQMSGAAKQLMSERAEFGQAVSSQAKMVESFDYNAFVKSNRASSDYLSRQGTLRKMGAMLGMQPDYSGAGQKMYEGGFDIAGGAVAGAAKWLGGAEDWLIGALDQQTGAMGITRGIRRGLSEIAGGGAASITSASDVSFGLRHTAKWLGIEDYLNEARGYDPRSMSRSQRARALGYSGKESGVVEFLNTAEAQMNTDFGLNAQQQKTFGTEYADLLYGGLSDERNRQNWINSYGRGGFNGVANVYQRIQRGGSAGLKEAAARAKTKAEKAQFIAMLESEGELTDELRVAGALTGGLGKSYSSLEQGLEQARGIREEAFSAFREGTKTKGRGEETYWQGVGRRGAKAARWAYGFASYGMSEALGIGAALETKLSDATRYTVSEDELKDFMDDSELRDSFIKWQSGSSEEEKRAGRRELESRVGSFASGDRRKSTWARLRTAAKSGSENAKNALKSMAGSYLMEASLEYSFGTKEFGIQLRSAMEGANTKSMGREGKAAWLELQEIANLRASGEPEGLKEASRRERDLMENIVGTTAGKDVAAALSGREGGEYVLAGLSAGTGMYETLRKMGGGRGRRGRQRAHENKMSYIMENIARASGLDIGGGAFLEGLGVKSREDIIGMLSKGGESTQSAVEKILSVAKTQGLEGSGFKAFQRRMERVGTAGSDAEFDEEELRGISGSLGGQAIGNARARSRTEKTPTADGQKMTNKHLSTISTAVLTIASKSAGLDLSPESLRALKDAIKSGTKPGEE